EETPTLEDVAKIIEAAEQTLIDCGEGLRFQVTPQSGLRIVRRQPTKRNEPARYEPVFDLKTEPALWLIDRPEGRYCLLVPLGEPNSAANGPRGPAELYFDGMPISWRTATIRPSLLEALYEIALFLWHALPTRGQEASSAPELG